MYRCRRSDEFSGCIGQRAVAMTREVVVMRRRDNGYVVTHKWMMMRGGR